MATSSGPKSIPWSPEGVEKKTSMWIPGVPTGEVVIPEEPVDDPVEEEEEDLGE